MRFDERAAPVDDEELGLKHGPRRSAGQPASASGGPLNRAESSGLRPGVGTGAVLFGLEDHVDLTAAPDGRFEISREFGEGVGGVADEQYAPARAGDELCRTAAVRRRSPVAHGPVHTGRDLRASASPRLQSDAQRQCDIVARERRARRPRGRQCCDGVVRARWGSRRDLGEEAAMRYCLADYGLVFSTRDRGARTLADLREKMAGARTVVIDFSNVRGLSYSFVDEFIWQLMQDVAASGATQPVLANVPPSAARTIERSLRRRRVDVERVLAGVPAPA